LFLCNTVNKLLKEKNSNKTPFYKNIKLNTLKEEHNKQEHNKEEHNKEEPHKEEDDKEKHPKEDYKEEKDLEQEVSDKNYISVIKKIKKENITPNNIDEIMLCQIPGISSVTALAIINKFKSISNLIKELETNSECLKDLTYTNSKSQSKKINKTCVTNIEKFLLKK
jgi:ABC-type Zn2+ transport system substrate-binding protein/surface adhesin